MAKIKITSCTGEGYWYNSLVGEKIVWDGEIDEDGDAIVYTMDFTIEQCKKLTENYTRRKAYIARIDFELVDENIFDIDDLIHFLQKEIA